MVYIVKRNIYGKHGVFLGQEYIYTTRSFDKAVKKWKELTSRKKNNENFFVDTAAASPKKI